MSKLISRYVKQFRMKYQDELKNEDGNERLRLLALFLEHLPEERFSLRTWSDAAFDVSNTNHCGTSACACGWATTVFDGIYLDKGTVVLSNNRKRSWDAVLDFFDLRLGEAKKMFSESYYYEKATPKMVAERIKEFLDKT